VVLEGGSALLTAPWNADVEALLMAWYPGQEGGTALARLLAGDVSPSGRLPVSFPVADADLPAFDHTSLEVTYDLFHGYTYLEREGIAPAYPFGAGLGYGTVTYDAVDVTADAEAFHVTVTVSSVDRAGDEVVLLFVSPPAGAAPRAVRELRGFERVSLTAGQTETITLDVPRSELARWDETTNAWVIDPGVYTFSVGALSATAS
jgi:beta-glucosidase